MEFGLRRAQGPDAGTYGARAAVIGGCDGTSNVLAGKCFDIPILGTHAHSWIMSLMTNIMLSVLMQIFIQIPALYLLTLMTLFVLVFQMRSVYLKN